ncbi:hypothetical protein LTR62_006878 [Meristemomyces frigidus]|uniref:ABM domain-containing protein n=1 Tax=Meristemomyces frigidus TaxID=1508187 RepID=A0AAN7YIB9_9PEZI|nr:hypothetical protein LTR62_006878 [Meristemomyces frigidus]
MPVTEFVTISLVPGSDITNPRHPTSVALRNMMDASQKTQVPGQLMSRVGMQVEHPLVLETVIIWDSLEAHMAYMQTPAYTTIKGVVQSIREPDKKGSMQHFKFTPFDGLKQAISAPMTEVARFFYNDYPDEKMLAGFIEFGKRLDEGNVEGALGCSAALPDDEVGYDYGEGRVILLVIGWQSIAAHEAFKKTQLFTDLVPLLKSEKAANIELHHTRFGLPI